VDVVAKAMETMLGGRNVTRYKRDAEQYDVIVQTQASGRTTPEDIDGIFVRGRNDAMIPLSSLVKVRESVSAARAEPLRPAPLGVHHRQPGARLFAGRGAGLHGPGRQPGCSSPATATDLNGTSREFRNSQGALAVVFVLALVFIFLVLAAQFESFIDPLVIMLSVPLSMVVRCWRSNGRADR
jgi:multidrug efflux pump